ncbi:hypothetical protein JHD94_23135 [Enterobacter roggenkampii]|uniref:hypothetical protein n=1 Tax=Enterobacter roggenkampii TaxID=1812935 RepID=UPI00190ADFA8|nr:hypothetical protein [Enterobacter roggenkampii]MBK4126176.1 hypothetical protein [Enterobacter roggenkampii]
MTKVTTRCGASSKPEFSTGHPITNAFLQHQRVTTEGKTMNDKGLKQWQLDNIWEGLRNQSSRNHRRVMKKMRAKQSKQAA